MELMTFIIVKFKKVWLKWQKSLTFKSYLINDRISKINIFFATFIIRLFHFIISIGYSLFVVCQVHESQR